MLLQKKEAPVVKRRQIHPVSDEFQYPFKATATNKDELIIPLSLGDHHPYYFISYKWLNSDLTVRVWGIYKLSGVQKL